jgi:hypothetical protein
MNVLSQGHCDQCQGHDRRREHGQRAIALHEKGAEADLKALTGTPSAAPPTGKLAAGAWTKGTGAEKHGHDGLLNGGPIFRIKYLLAPPT